MLSKKTLMRDEAGGKNVIEGPRSRIDCLRGDDRIHGSSLAAEFDLRDLLL